MPQKPLTGKMGEKLGIKNPWTGREERRTVTPPRIKDPFKGPSGTAGGTLKDPFKRK